MPGEAIAQGEVLIASGGQSLCIAREGPFLIVQGASSSQTPDVPLGGAGCSDSDRTRSRASAVD